MANEQEILINFIGSNYGIMKKLDDQIVGSSSTLGRRSDELMKVLNDVVAAPTQQPPQPQVTLNTQILQTNIPIQQPIQQPVPQQQIDDQLWLDFEERDKIYDLLDSIIEKQNIILKKLEKLENNYTISRKRGI